METPNYQTLFATERVPSTLIETVKVPISDRQKRIFQLIDEEDFSGVTKKVFHELKMRYKIATKEYLTEGILALKQYYAICFMDNNPHAISDTLDPFWHSHILHTVDYHKFCEKCEIDYMHHVPNDPDNTKESESLRILYDHTQRVFSKCFNWVSPVFNDPNTKTENLVCKHYTQTRFVHEGDFAFVEDPFLTQLQYIKESYGLS